MREVELQRHREVVPERMVGRAAVCTDEEVAHTAQLPGLREHRELGALDVHVQKVHGAEVPQELVEELRRHRRRERCDLVEACRLQL